MGFFSGWGEWWKGMWDKIAATFSSSARRNQADDAIFNLTDDDIPAPKDVFEKLPAMTQPPRTYLSGEPIAPEDDFSKGDLRFDPAGSISEYIRTVFVRPDKTQVEMKIEVSLSVPQKSHSIPAKYYIGFDAAQQPFSATQENIRADGTHDTFGSEADREKAIPAFYLMNHLQAKYRAEGFTTMRQIPGYGAMWAGSDVLYLEVPDGMNPDILYRRLAQDLRVIQNEFERSPPVISPTIQNMKIMDFIDGYSKLRTRAEADHLKERITSIVAEHIDNDDAVKKLTNELVAAFELHATPSTLKAKYKQEEHLSAAVKTLLAEHFPESTFRRDTLFSTVYTALRQQEGRELG